MVRSNNFNPIFAFTLKQKEPTISMVKLRSLGTIIAAAAIAVLSACGSKQSTNFVSDKTGWNFNDPKMGGYDVAQFNGQVQAPGVSYIPGGRFTMGQVEEDLMDDNNNVPHNVSVASFYMDQTEVANIHYREYVYWLTRAYGADYPQLIMNSLPDSTCWRKALQFNEPLVENYFRHGSFNYYPVVGVNWRQANEYCKWRSDRVNELILIKLGYLKKNPNQVAEDVFTTKSYYASQYEGAVGVKKRDLDPTGGGRRNVRMEDGLLLPDFRLPTEAEWEFAALALVENSPEIDRGKVRGEPVVTDRKVYPWGDNNSTRDLTNNQNQGKQRGNFVQGLGDYAGIAGANNDNSFRTAPVMMYQPNAHGLYCMAGNVSEWVMDVYRPEMAVDGLEPFRGNVFMNYKALEDGSLEEKDSLGRMVQTEVTQAELADKNIDFRQADLRDYADGDTTEGEERRFINQSFDDPENGARNMTTLVSNQSRVVKGGSWNDRAYWMSPGTRRFYKETHSASTIGFRCCIDALGWHNPGNNFKLK
jgi:formylglycine-generating enzyme